MTSEKNSPQAWMKNTPAICWKLSEGMLFGSLVVAELRIAWHTAERACGKFSSFAPTS